MLATPASAEERRWLVPGDAFDPLSADPRWPHFRFGYERVIEADGLVFGQEYENLWTVAFGDTVAFYSGPLGQIETFEVGAQPALFATLDPFHPTEPLINADYQGGIYVAARKDKWSILSRVYHQSSHLGDELLLFGPPVERFNFSFETWESLISWNSATGLRAYGGVGWIFHETGRGDYGNLKLQYGVELTGDLLTGGAPPAFGPRIRQYAAIDIQHLQGRDFQPDFSAQLGLRVGDDDAGRLDVSLTYYNGRNPNGQFYTEDIESAGIAILFRF